MEFERNRLFSFILIHLPFLPSLEVDEYIQSIWINNKDSKKQAQHLESFLFLEHLNYSFQV